MRRGDQSVRPFLRWAGGKRELLPQIIPHCPATPDRYLEPFVGSGALFFELNPNRAVLSDVNRELINAYVVVRDSVDEVIDGLNRLQQDSTTYYRIRAQEPRGEVGRAVRFIYLNRTSFNGLWRVNRDGVFNVPFGNRPRPDLVKEARLRAASHVLQRVELVVCDFERTLRRSKLGDFVYVDPPYTVKHEENGFRRYNEALFSWEDQERLARAARMAAARGARVVVSNARHSLIRQLYSDFTEVKVERSSRLAADVEARTTVKESLFLSP